MRIAILIQCHKNPKQINLLLERLNHPDIDCYLHIDKKADFADKIIHRENNSVGTIDYEYDKYGNCIHEKYGNGYEIFNEFDENGNYIRTYDNYTEGE